LRFKQSGSLVEIEKYLKYLVIDEADLMFGFGYKQDMLEILKFLPKQTCQTYLVSATLNPDIANLKQLFLTNPVLIKLSESERNEKVVHYYMYAEENDKFLLINALFKFKLMTGRTIIFVNSVNRCYKLKLFLEQFGIRSVLLNSELPLTSRCHAIDQFNKGFYDIIVANDEKCLANPVEVKKKRRFVADAEFTVARGIDFQNVNNVINLDFPDSVISYIHRVGRTGRGPHEDTDGTVLSLINANEKRHFLNVQNAFAESSNFKAFRFKMNELDSLRYRTRDAHRMITKIAINEARVKEIKRELLTSEKLRSYFEENAKDWKALKQDKELHIVRPVPHLKHMPDYIVPDSLQSTVKADTSRKRWYEDGEDIPFSIPAKKAKKRRPAAHNSRRKTNPLRSFKTSKKTSSKKK
jgi:ATP-dependent RNA helicase DDX56/DBP9